MAQQVPLVTGREGDFEALPVQSASRYAFQRLTPGVQALTEQDVPPPRSWLAVLAARRRRTDAWSS